MKLVRSRLAHALLTAVAVGAVAAGCSDDDDDDVFFPTDQGQLEVFIADAPPLFEQLQALNMTITRVDAISAVATGATTGTDVPLFFGARQIDLLPLRGGQRELIAQGAVPAGVYEQVRLYFTDTSVDYDVGGTTQTFSTNNGLLTLAGVDTTTQPGTAILTLELPGTGVQVDNGETEQVLIDIDVEESLDLQPNATDPANMTFTPMARVRELADSTTGGTVSGVIRNDAGTAGNTTDDTPVNNAKVTLTDSGANVVAVTRTDTQGAYVFDGIEAGQYQLDVEAINGAPSQTDVNVNAGQQTTQDVILVDTTP